MDRIFWLVVNDIFASKRRTKTTKYSIFPKILELNTFDVAFSLSWKIIS